MNKNKFNQKIITELRSLSKDSNISADFEKDLLAKLNSKLDNKYTLSFAEFLNPKYFAPFFVFLIGVFLFTPLLFVNKNDKPKENRDSEESFDATKMGTEENSLAAPEISLNDSLALDSTTNANYTTFLSCLNYPQDEVLIENEKDFLVFLEKYGSDCNKNDLLNIDFDNFALIGKRIKTSGCYINTYSTNIAGELENTVLINVDKFGDCIESHNEINWFLVEKSVVAKNFRIEIVENIIE